MIEALRPGVVSLIRDLNGNHVIQRCLQVSVPEYCTCDPSDVLGHMVLFLLHHAAAGCTLLASLYRNCDSVMRLATQRCMRVCSWARGCSGWGRRTHSSSTTRAASTAWMSRRTATAAA